MEEEVEERKVEGIVEETVEANDCYFNWFNLEGDQKNSWLEAFEGKKVRITVELIK